MPASTPLALIVLLLPVAASAAPQATGTDPGGGVTIYRCTDAKGRLSLRDSPCLPGERQDVRTMLRPKDAPPRPVVAMPPRDDTRTPASSPSPPGVFLQTPRPLYVCGTPVNTR